MYVFPANIMSAKVKSGMVSWDPAAISGPEMVVCSLRLLTEGRGGGEGGAHLLLFRYHYHGGTIHNAMLKIYQSNTQTPTPSPCIHYFAKAADERLYKHSWQQANKQNMMCWRIQDSRAWYWMDNLVFQLYKCSDFKVVPKYRSIVRKAPIFHLVHSSHNKDVAIPTFFAFSKGNCTSHSITSSSFEIVKDNVMTHAALITATMSQA